ncbi:MAG TPA: DUF983 domain-containing protein [Burkholderiaceae bacterium]|nr:DUF983 domain-containing protein [Burkholderiaceae bacterium]
MASPVATGLQCRCPRCGRGRLFAGYLTLVEKCESCGLDLRAMDSGDGPAFFVMFLVLIVTVPLVFLVWAVFEPPIWVHMVLWPVVILGLSLWLLRPAKGIMVALQFKHRAGQN